MNQPLISVIIPAYNAEKTLRRAVRSACEQTHRNLEILVLDDASTDDSRDIAREMAAEDERISLLTNEQNLGVARTRNRGMDFASGQYIAFLDADDQWMAEKLEKQLRYMEENRLDLCYTAYSLHGGEGEGRAYHVPEAVGFDGLLRENVIGCSTVLVRTTAVGDIRMRPEYGHEDYVFWLELLRAGLRAGGINEVLMRYTVAPESRSGDKKKAAAERWRIYREFLRLPFPKAAWVFGQYAARSVRKRM